MVKKLQKDFPGFEGYSATTNGMPRKRGSRVALFVHMLSSLGRSVFCSYLRLCWFLCWSANIVEEWIEKKFPCACGYNANIGYIIVDLIAASALIEGPKLF